MRNRGSKKLPHNISKPETADPAAMRLDRCSWQNGSGTEVDMKKKTVWLVAASAAFVLLLSACSSSKPDYAPAPYPEAKEAYYEDDYYAGDYNAAVAYDEAARDYEGSSQLKASAGSGANTTPYNSENVKLIYRANISAETTNLEKTASEIEQLVIDMGGYIEDSSVDMNAGRTGTYRYGYYTVRVPSEKYQEFLDSISGSDVCTVTNLSKSVQDVGQQYADTEAHLATLRIKQERYQELLKQAEEMEDIILLESALSDVEYEIEFYSSDLNRYDSLIGFSTININLTEVNRATTVQETTTFGERFVKSFKNGLSDFAEGFEIFMLWLAWYWLPLLITIAIIVIVILIIKKAVSKGGAKKEKSPGTSRRKRKKLELSAAQGTEQPQDRNEGGTA